jgi:hypothetical protein
MQDPLRYLATVDVTFPGIDPAIGNLDVAMAIANRFHWNLAVEPAEGGQLNLFGGEVRIARFADEHELAVFVAGMGVALGVLPDEIAQMIDEWVGA